MRSCKGGSMHSEEGGHDCAPLQGGRGLSAWPAAGKPAAGSACAPCTQETPAGHTVTIRRFTLSLLFDSHTTSLTMLRAPKKPVARAP